MNDFWNTRNQSIRALGSNLQAASSIIYDSFSLLDELLKIFDSAKQTSDFCKVSGLTLLKARLYAQGVFSLSLDGLSQEAGALLRPLIECLELLEYLRLNPIGVREALDGKLPPAGKIGKIVKGQSQSLRDYLNRNASHFSFSFDSIRHMLDPKSLEWKTVRPYNEKVLKYNISQLSAILEMLILAASYCLDSCRLLPTSFWPKLRLQNFRVSTFTEGLEDFPPLPY